MGGIGKYDIVLKVTYKHQQYSDTLCHIKVCYSFQSFIAAQFTILSVIIVCKEVYSIYLRQVFFKLTGLDKSIGREEINGSLDDQGVRK